MKFNLHVHAWFDMSRVVFGQFVLLVLLTLLSSERKGFKICFLHCSIFSMPRIPSNLRKRTIGMFGAGMSTEHVARHVRSSSRVIRNLRIRFQTTGSSNDLPRRGRPRVTTRGQDRYIVNTPLRNQFQTATATAANTPGLHNNRISAHSMDTATLEYRSFFSDESRFSLQRGDGRVSVYRRRNERYADCCVLERDRFGGMGSVMVWAAIAHGYRSPLVVIDGNLNAQRYRNDILAHHVIPLFHNTANISIFQHDNVSSHTARDTVDFLRTNNIDFIDEWSANSPDLNPIEHVWDSLDRRLRRRPNPPANVNELRQALIQEWNNIS